MLDLWSTWESAALLWIQMHLRSEGATAFWESMTDLGNSGFLWIAIVMALLVWKKTRQVGTTAFLSLVINVAVTNGLLKLWVARPRPFTTYEEIIPLIAPPLDFSFPSGHSAASFAVAFVLYQKLPRKYGIPALAVAVLIAFSRLYLGVHYPSDVLAGVMVGFLASQAALYLMKKGKAWKAHRLTSKAEKC